MNVLLINGSPHKEGCTYHALCEVAKTLNAAGIETTIYHIGPAPVGGCVGCGGCAKAGHCVFGGPGGGCAATGGKGRRHRVWCAGTLCHGGGQHAGL